MRWDLWGPSILWLPRFNLAPAVFDHFLLMLYDDADGADGGETRRMFLFRLGVSGFSFWT